MALRSKTGENSGKILKTRFCRGTPANRLSFIPLDLSAALAVRLLYHPHEFLFKQLSVQVVESSAVETAVLAFIAKAMSGTKKEHKPKLLSPDIFWWGGGLPREGVGGQKVRYAPRNQGKETFLAGYPGFLPGYPGGRPEKFEKTNCVQFSSPTMISAPDA